MKMKLKDWIKFSFPINEYIKGGSSIDGSDCPVVHPIGMAPQSPANIDDFNLDSVNTKLCHSGHVRDWCSYGTEQRLKMLEHIHSHKFITVEKKTNFNTYISSLLSHKFICSPEGNGIDCHRHYEILICKGIPILQISNEKYSNERWKSESYMNKYQSLPVLWTKDYSDLSIELLNSTYKSFLEKEFNFEKLKKSYWLEKSPNLNKNMNFWLGKFGK